MLAYVCILPLSDHVESSIIEKDISVLFSRFLHRKKCTKRYSLTTTATAATTKTKLEMRFGNELVVYWEILNKRCANIFQPIPYKEVGLDFHDWGKFLRRRKVILVIQNDHLKQKV